MGRFPEKYNDFASSIMSFIDYGKYLKELWNALVDNSGTQKPGFSYIRPITSSDQGVARYLTIFFS